MCFYQLTNIIFLLISITKSQKFRTSTKLLSLFGFGDMSSNLIYLNVIVVWRIKILYCWMSGSILDWTLGSAHSKLHGLDLLSGITNSLAFPLDCAWQLNPPNSKQPNRIKGYMWERKWVYNFGVALQMEVGGNGYKCTYYIM